jgi:tol-pal system protein YbgF
VRAPVLAITLLAAGCGGAMANLRQDNQRLAGELASTRAELRGERRKAKDLANQILVLTDRLEASAVHGVSIAAPPPLPVEVLDPDALTEGGSLITDDDGGFDDGAEPIDLTAELEPRRAPPPPPPRAAPRAAGLRDLPTSTELTERPPAAPPTRPTAAPRAAATDDAITLYQRGMAALKARDHATAITTFRALIAAYPRHDYADNAQYWLGEAFYDQKDYARAVPEFRATVSSYPLGNKVPDALLKVGLSYAALGEPAKARAALEQVVRQFPTSPSAAIAATRLEQLP